MLTLGFKKNEHHNDVKGRQQSSPIFGSYFKNVDFTSIFFGAVIFWSEMHFWTASSSEVRTAMHQKIQVDSFLLLLRS